MTQLWLGRRMESPAAKCPSRANGRPPSRSALLVIRSNAACAEPPPKADADSRSWERALSGVPRVPNSPCDPTNGSGSDFRLGLTHVQGRGKLQDSEGPVTPHFCASAIAGVLAASTVAGAPLRDGPALTVPRRGCRPEEKQVHLGVGGRPWTQLHARLQRSLQQSKLLDTESVLVAVSGGQDSVCLLQALVDLQPRWGWRLGVVHCDHGWRPDSASNADWVRRWAQQLGLPCHVRAAAPGAVRTERSAREWRYGVFADVAAAEGFRTVVTAHTATDRAETLLLNLLRGAGPDGLVALSRLRPLAPGSDSDAAGREPALPCDLIGDSRAATAASSAPRVMLARPLLEFTREETQALVQRLGLSIYHDTTNDCNDIRRNRLRNEVLPALRRHFNPRLDQALFRFMEVLDSEMELVEGIAQQLYGQVLATDHDDDDDGEDSDDNGSCAAQSARAQHTDAAIQHGAAGRQTGPVSTSEAPSCFRQEALLNGGSCHDRTGSISAGDSRCSPTPTLRGVAGPVLANGAAICRHILPAALQEAADIAAGAAEGISHLPAQAEEALDLATLRVLPLALQRRVVHHWLRSAVARRQSVSGDTASGGSGDSVTGVGGSVRRRRNGCAEVGYQDVANCLGLLHAPNRSKSDSLCGGLVAAVDDGRLMVKTAREWAEEEEELARMLAADVHMLSQSLVGRTSRGEFGKLRADAVPGGRGQGQGRRRRGSSRDGKTPWRVETRIEVSVIRRRIGRNSASERNKPSAPPEWDRQLGHGRTIVALPQQSLVSEPVDGLSWTVSGDGSPGDAQRSNAANGSGLDEFMEPLLRAMVGAAFLGALGRLD